MALASSPLAPIIAFAISCMCAWKAADMLGAGNFLAAVALGALFALLGPYLLSDLITATLADFAAEASTGDEDVGLSTMQIGFGASRMACALIGVLAWCGIEQAI